MYNFAKYEIYFLLYNFLELKIDQNDDLLVEEKINHQENEELQKIINYLLSEETYYKLLAG